MQTNISKLQCQKAMLFHRPKVLSLVKGVFRMKIVNKTNFEHGAPPGVNEYRAPPGVIFAFYNT